MEHTEYCSIVTVRTVEHRSQEPRNVSLIYTPTDNSVTLLGVLYHGDHITVDQELVNDLQELVNMQKEN